LSFRAAVITYLPFGNQRPLEAAIGANPSAAPSFQLGVAELRRHLLGIIHHALVSPLE
jgi:hypothetical protein